MTNMLRSGNSLPQQRPGATLMELIIYLAISGLVIVGAMNWLTNTLSARAATVRETALQENLHTVLDTMTVSIRNAYEVSFASGILTIKTHPANDRTQTTLTMYRVVDNRLQFGPSADTLTSVTSSDVRMTTFDVVVAGPSATINLVGTNGVTTTRVATTVTTRQIP